MYATQYSFFAVVWVSLLFYGLWIIKKRPWRGSLLLLGIFIINVLNIFNGNRMHMGIMLFVFAFSLLVFFFQNRNNHKLLLHVGTIVVGMAIVLLMVFLLDVGNVREIPYVKRFLGLATSARVEIYKSVIKQMPYYIWGGNCIDLLGYGHTHNQWLQMYNETGIITFCLLCIFTLLNIVDCVKMFRSKTIETEIKYIVLSVLFGVFLYFCFEAAAQGESDYFVYYPFFAGMVSQIVYSDKESEKKLACKKERKDETGV